VDAYLTEAQTMALFHVVREALSNTLKHARASLAEVNVTLDDDKAQLIIEIRDNGAGFAMPAEGFPEGRRGLRNMQQRVASLGGTLRVRSAPGQGAAVQLIVPSPPRPLTPAPTGTAPQQPR
jgi:signal transduction histidine kinase